MTYMTTNDRNIIITNILNQYIIIEENIGHKYIKAEDNKKF